jgi:hypothetical protein
MLPHAAFTLQLARSRNVGISDDGYQISDGTVRCSVCCSCWENEMDKNLEPFLSNKSKYHI